ncbi:NAD(P)-binding protein [Xylona heveae TC161]|uniref:3-dehydrosphinganine reductase n=1 Tax=Xylona heveae (strain CBS 132557 / TC161) TaxID=1328760 RepID=A0A165JNV9_XYLHT|nr:NAD(P)-binding protein [Xylona heveae TC161]KZF26464.1 NAD(P)-binding protein [Xylona heveae TC161]
MALGFFWATILLGFFASVLALDIMGLFRRKNHFPVEGRTVLITGGSQGMGRGVAKLLAQKGANVLIVARDVKKLESAVEYIQAAAKSPAQRFHYISADLMNPAESERIMHEAAVWNNNNPPDVVWCIAGSAAPELFLNTPVERHRQLMDSNYWSAAYLAHATLRSWFKPRTPPPATPASTTTTSKSVSETETPVTTKEQSASQAAATPPARHLIFTSSVLAFYPIIGYNGYSPAKAALRSLSDALSQEINLYNGARHHNPSLGPTADVKVHTVFPGTIYTPGYEHENETKPAITKLLEAGDPGQTEDECAAVSVRGLERGEYLITVAFLGSAMRACAWGGSPRGNFLLDTLMTWITSIAWLFIQPDMDKKVWRWGRANGMPKDAKSA